MSDDEAELLRRKLAREQSARREAETLLEGKSRELYARNEALQQEIAVREQIERDLAKQASALARSNEELQQFAYVASHDLQAPLRNILGFSRLLSSKCSDQLGTDGQEFLQFIQEGARSMHELINDLLDLSRVETRSEPARPLDANTVMQQVMQSLAQDITASGAHVEHDVLPTVYADASQLRQLLQNLLSNALKFQSPDNAPQIIVTCTREQAFWQFCVADNGIGIAPEHADRIFVIFRRLHTTDEYAGTGIGLAICKKIVERHGGSIWVDAAPGAGTRIFFTLPVEPVDADDAVTVGASAGSS